MSTIPIDKRFMRNSKSRGISRRFIAEHIYSRLHSRFVASGTARMEPKRAWRKSGDGAGLGVKAGRTLAMEVYDCDPPALSFSL